MKRLMDEHSGELQRAMLSSALADGPTPASRARAAQRLGIASAVGVACVTASTQAIAHGSAAAFRGGGILGKVQSVGLLKWIAAVGVPVGLAGAVAWSAQSRIPRSKGVATASTHPGTEAPSHLETPYVNPSVDSDNEQRRVAHVPLDDVAAPRVSRAKTSGADTSLRHQALRSGESTSLAEGLAHLDSARRHIRQGQGAAALDDLDAYDGRFADQSLDEVERALRIEATFQVGRDEAALAMARRFLKAYPASPFAARVRSLAHLE